MNQQSQIPFERVRRSIQSRFNPIRNLTPETLARMLENFAVGNIKEAAITWDAIEKRDDRLMCVAPKRKKAVSRLSWEIVLTEDSPEAQRHKEVLEYFYNNITVTDAIDQNQRGGFNLLVRQMMDAAGKKYAVHEIVWNPQPDGLVAEFRFVPLWFFENRTGKLRFLREEFALEGEELEDAAWLVTCGDGLMEACSVAYMFKHLPLKDWLLYCEKHGMPGIQGKTDAAQGSKEWNAMVEAVAAIANDFSCVTGKGDEIAQLDFSTKGELPFPPLVDRMDRAMAALWRGGDLSSMSAGMGQGQGASVQEEEGDILEADDAEMISDTLNIQIDPWVIRYSIGEKTPLAYVKVVMPPKQDTDRDLKVDQFLLNGGFPLSIEDAAERYGRSIPEKKEELLVKPQALAAPDLANEAQNESLIQKAMSEALGVVPNWLSPVKKFLKELEEKLRDETLDDKDLLNFLERAAERLPELFKEMDVEELADVLEAAMGTAAIRGLRDNLQKTKGSEK